jgi:uncharacterized protein (TIGR02266 family)
MAQDTRKDPRAKVLTMTVRYKSATLDEFIEHHSHDISRGGMFIKTPSPFPPGTLLKFEVKIAEDKRVMQGVGRVVWKRESNDASDTRPAGMGVKFIKIDEESKAVIDRLVGSRIDAGSSYETGKAEMGVVVSEPPPAPRPGVVVHSGVSTSKASVELKPSSPTRKGATMIGLGAVTSDSPAALDKAKRAESAEAEQPFFPPTKSQEEMPAPEDRTMMKQAAELLQDALREAGGSLEDVVGASQAAPKKEADKRPEPRSATPARVEAVPRPRSEPRLGRSEPESKKSDRPLRDKPGVSKPATADKAASLKPAEGTRSPQSRPPQVRSSQPRTSGQPRAADSRPSPAQAPGAQKDSTGKTVLVVMGALAAAGIIYFVGRPKQAEEPAVTPPAPSEPAVVPAPSAPPAASEAPATETPKSEVDPVPSAQGVDAGAQPAERPSAEKKPPVVPRPVPYPYRGRYRAPVQPTPPAAPPATETAPPTAPTPGQFGPAPTATPEKPTSPAPTTPAEASKPAPAKPAPAKPAPPKPVPQPGKKPLDENPY